MPLNYSISMMGNPLKKDEPKKAYAKAQINNEVSLKDLSKRIASQTTVSRADVTAVLISAVENMIEVLRAGDQMDFGELGKFRLQITSKGAASSEEFTAAFITGVNIQFIPGNDLKEIFTGMAFTPVPTRAAVKAVLRAQKAGETMVDISTSDKSSNDDNPGPNTPEDGNSGSGGGEDNNPL